MTHAPAVPGARQKAAQTVAEPACGLPCTAIRVSATPFVKVDLLLTHNPRQLASVSQQPHLINEDLLALQEVLAKLEVSDGTRKSYTC